MGQILRIKLLCELVSAGFLLGVASTQSCFVSGDRGLRCRSFDPLRKSIIEAFCQVFYYCTL